MLLLGVDNGWTGRMLHEKRSMEGKAGGHFMRTQRKQSLDTADAGSDPTLSGVNASIAAMLAGESPDDLVRRIIAAGGVRSHLQPIVAMSEPRMLGVEALLRGWCDLQQRLIPPASLFRTSDPGLLQQLENHARQAAVKAFSELTSRTGDQPLLFMNLDLSEICTGDTGVTPEMSCERLVEMVQQHGLTPDRVALELLESRFGDDDAVERSAALMRRAGFVLVLDDMGSGHANLDRVCLIRPDILKLDRSLIADIETDHHKRETFKCLARLARRTGALVVAEGIETRSQGVAAMELGADLLQGFFLSRPAPAETLDFDQTVARASMLAAEFRRELVGTITRRRAEFVGYDRMLHEVCAALAGCEVSRFEELLTRLCLGTELIECVYVIAPDGQQVTSTLMHPEIRRRNERLFAAAGKGTDHSFKDYFFLLRETELTKFTTGPYVSRATGMLCRTISTRLSHNGDTYVLCVDVTA